jgi:SAM-dependent methyltransferase
MQTEHRNCPTCENREVDLFHRVDGFSVVRCKQCRFVFVDISNEDSEAANIYDERTLQVYYAYQPVYTMAFYDSTVKKLEHQTGRESLRILDFGCGAGMFMRRARARGHSVAGVDFSPYANLARQRFNLEIYCEDLRTCPLPTESFDVIISHATYEHLMDPLGLTNELLRFLKPGGLFIVSGVPNFSNITIQWFKNFYRNGLGHVNHFERDSLRRLYSAAGIEVIDVKAYGLGIWGLVDSVKGLRAKPGMSWPEFTDEFASQSSLIDIYDSYIPNISERLLSLAYTKLPPSFISLSLEAWGKKPLQ